MLKIDSRDNQKIKQARKTRDGAAENLIFAEGLRLCEEVLRSGSAVEQVFVREDFAENARGGKFLRAISAATDQIFAVSKTVFDSITDTKNSQGVIVIARKPETGRHKIEAGLSKPGKTPLVVLLHRVGNPSNLGAILRTAEAADASGVILTPDSADAFSPKALRGAMGAALRLPVWTGADFFDVLDWARRNALMSVAADVRAEKSYLEIDWSAPRLLIFGSEAHGLSERETAGADETFKIPMANGVESLNLAVSAGIILFEATRRMNLAAGK